MVNKVSELPKGQGFNAATLTYGDLLADGVVDPVKVTRSAVLNAASVARMILTTETAIVDKPADAEDGGTAATVITATRTRTSGKENTPGRTTGGVLRRIKRRRRTAMTGAQRSK